MAYHSPPLGTWPVYTRSTTSFGKKARKSALFLWRSFSRSFCIRFIRSFIVTSSLPRLRDCPDNLLFVAEADRLFRTLFSRHFLFNEWNEIYFEFNVLKRQGAIFYIRYLSIFMSNKTLYKLIVLTTLFTNFLSVHTLQTYNIYNIKNCAL